MSLSLGIDIGTSGVRTAVINPDGDVLSAAKANHLPQNIEHIDAVLWWDAVKNCLHAQINALTSNGISPSDIRHIAVDGTSGTMVLVDTDLNPVTRALMYNSKGFDAEAKRIAQHAPEIHITQGSNSALARALRLISEDQPNKAEHLLHQADFIAAKLMGVGGYSDHNNALKTGFDPYTACWPEWFNALLDYSLLPDAKPVGTPLQNIAAGIASEFGLSPKTVVHAGTTDSIAAFLALAPMEQGVAVTSLGSTLAVKMLASERIDDPAIGLYSHKLQNYWLVGGASNTGGAVLAHYFNADDIEKLSEQIDPGTKTNLEYYPLLKPGERFPVNDPELLPMLTPRPDDDAVFLQAMLEGIARIEAECYSQIRDRGGEFPHTILSAGGGAKNKTFTQIRADTLGITPQICAETEAAVGAAKLGYF